MTDILKELSAERLHEFVAGARGPYTGLVSDIKSTLERIDTLTARISEIEKPVEDAEAIDAVDAILAVGVATPTHETARRVVNIFERLRRERDALSSDLKTEQTRREAAEWALANTDTTRRAEAAEAALKSYSAGTAPTYDIRSLAVKKP